MKRIAYTFVTFACISSILMIGACKKTTTPNGLVKSYANSHTAAGITTNGTTTLTYDGQNRLTEIQPSSGTPTTFSYGSGSVTQSQGGNSVVFQLNSGGLAISDNVGDVFVYDNNGYNTTTTTTVGGTVTSTTTNSISGGNVANSQTTQGGVTSTTTYTYLSNVDYRNYGQAFFGKNSVDLVNSQSVSNPVTTTFTFSYTFDSQGRVQTQTYISGTTTDVTTYTYVF